MKRRASAILASLAVLAGSLVAAVAAGQAASASSCSASGAAGVSEMSPPAGTFHALSPTRLLDTRTGLGAPAAGKVDTDCVARVELSTGAVPSTARAVALSVTTVDAATQGFVSAYACGSPRPYASNVNLRVNDATPNLVVVPVDQTFAVCLYASAPVHLVADVTGWFGEGDANFAGVTPTRVLDTRAAVNGSPGAPIAAGSVRTLSLAGTVAAGVNAVAVNVTATEPRADGYVAVYPCGASTPTVSNVNYLRGQNRSVQAMVGLGAGQTLCIFSYATAHVVVDLWGVFGPTTTNAFAPALASRVADSRDGTGGWAGAFLRGETRMLSIPGGRLPIGVTTLVLNLTAAGTNDEGYLTAFPCVTVDDPVPVASSVNFTPGVATANLVTVPLSATSRICVYSSAPTHVIVDLLASFGAPGGLNALSVSPLSLRPAFSPSIHDYTVPCAEGTNALSVSANAALDDATVTINGNLIGKAIPASISVQENQAIVARVTTFAGASDEYWIRCLPADFPALTVSGNGASQPGYYLATTGFLASTTQPYVMILDENGTPVWYRKMPSPPGVFTAARTASGYIATVEPLGDAFGTDPTGSWHETTVDGFQVKSYRTVNSPTDLHEFVQLSNGNVMLFSYPVRQHVDLTGLGNGLTNDEPVVDGHIQEIDPSGNLVWEWKSEEHISTAETTFVAQFPVGDQDVTDLVHFNSIDVAPNGDLIVSSRHTDAVYRIDRSTGKIVWKMGGNSVVGDGAKKIAIVGDPYGSFARQHDARLQPNGDIALFDNETAVVGKAARAVQYRLDVLAGTATMVWEYRKGDATNSPAMGSARRAANGDTVIAWGLAQPMLTEVDATGAMLLEVTAPDGGNYRTIKYGLRDFDRTQLRFAAGL